MLIACTELEPIAMVSSPVAEMLPVFWMLRIEFATVERTARPVPVCVIVPLFCSVVGVTAVPLDMVTATVPPLWLIAPPLSTVPVPPASVCAPVVVPFGIGFGPGLNWARAEGAGNVNAKRQSNAGKRQRRDRVIVRGGLTGFVDRPRDSMDFPSICREQIFYGHCSHGSVSRRDARAG